MLEIASQIVICLLIAALIGFIIGYLVAKGSSKKTNTTDTEKQEKTVTPVTEETVNQDEEENTEELSNTQPELLTAAREGKKDKLTKIKGIGPKVEEQLNKAGIYHFDQIANWTDENIEWLEVNTTFAHRAKKDLWVTQAKSFN